MKLRASMRVVSLAQRSLTSSRVDVAALRLIPSEVSFFDTRHRRSTVARFPSVSAAAAVLDLRAETSAPDTLRQSWSWVPWRLRAGMSGLAGHEMESFG